MSIIDIRDMLVSSLSFDPAPNQGGSGGAGRNGIIVITYMLLAVKSYSFALIF
jgi:hypothetical protein